MLTDVDVLLSISIMLSDSFVSPEPMHDNGTQTIKAEVVEPIVEVQETCREEANTSSSYSPSPRTVYTCNDGKVSLTALRDSLYYQLPQRVAEIVFSL